MVNISKNAMQPQIAKHIQDQFADLFVANETKKDFKNVLFELLSTKERIMLAKRIAIVELLTKEYSTYKISRLLKVSNATISSVSTNMELGKLNTICEIVKRRSKRGKIVHTLEEILTFGFPGNPQRKLRKRNRRFIEQWKAGGK